MRKHTNSIKKRALTTRGEIHGARISLLLERGAKCEWCGLPKEPSELTLHHIDWGKKSMYSGVREYGIQVGRHRAGYNPADLKLVCQDCQNKIHSSPQEAERRGFKRRPK